MRQAQPNQSNNVKRPSRRPRTRPSAFEPLEPRLLFTTATPTDFEQYELQLLNRARANPPAEVTRLSGMTWGDDPSVVPGTAYPKPQTANLNEGLPANTISAAAKQPLAFNLNLISGARSYSQTLLANNAFTHTYGGTDPMSRMQAAGYTFSGSYGAGENLAATASTGPYNISTAVAEQHHDNLFVDNNEPGRGHRVNLMNGSFKEVGIGLAQGSNYTGFGNGVAYNAVITTQDFAYVTGNSFLTGVAFTDAVTKDNFYTPGEGLGGVTITATPSGGGAALSTTTWSSGGYTLQVPAGTYTVTASGPGFASPVSYTNVVVGSLNVEEDFVPSTAPAVSSTTVGDGTSQRSVVKNYTVGFSQPVTLAAGAITLAKLQTDSGGNVTSSTDVSGGITITNPSNDGKTWVVSPVSGGAVYDGGSFADGIYRLTVHASLVTAGGTALAGGDQSYTFHRLYGDTDGNKTVNPADYAKFKNAFGSGTGSAAYSAALDVDGNGTINAADYAQFKKRFGVTFVYT